MDKNHPSLLVGTLFCGENEFQRSKESLRIQKYDKWDHFVLKNLPNRKAHNELYNVFMRESKHYDIFLKLDADMVFNTKNALNNIVNIFQNNTDLDHLVIPVKDWYSNTFIEGLHVFSNRAQWYKSDDNRFVDISPVVPGKRLKITTDPDPIVIHSPNPSRFQSFRFGVHRGLKVVQPNRQKLRYQQSRFQWKTLCRCWSHFRHSNDNRLGLSLAGAQEVISGRASGEYYNKQHKKLRALYGKYSELAHGELRQWLTPKWDNRLERTRRYINAVGPARFWKGYCSHLADRVYENSREIFD